MDPLPLQQRARFAERKELDGIPWLAVLDAGAREQALAAIRVSEVLPGEHVCRIGRPVVYLSLIHI